MKNDTWLIWKEKETWEGSEDWRREKEEEVQNKYWNVLLTLCGETKTIMHQKSEVRFNHYQEQHLVVQILYVMHESHIG